jgi:hypothetical protein
VTFVEGPVSEAAELSKIVESDTRVLQAAEFESRLTKIEKEIAWPAASSIGARGLLLLALEKSAPFTIMLICGVKHAIGGLIAVGQIQPIAL